MSCKLNHSACPQLRPIYQAWLTSQCFSPLCFVLGMALKCVNHCPTPSQSLLYTFTSYEGRKLPQNLRKVARQVGCLLKQRSYQIKGWPHWCCFLRYRSHVPPFEQERVDFFKPRLPKALINMKDWLQSKFQRCCRWPPALLTPTCSLTAWSFLRVFFWLCNTQHGVNN